MPRVPRWRQLARDAAYHVMSRGHNRQAIFADPDDVRYFLGLLDRYRRRFGFRLYHYCVLSNHFHLLLQPEDPRRLSSLLAGLLLAYARYCNGRHGFVGHLFQGRFRSPLVQRDGYWLSCGRYIERNPLEVGLVDDPWHYPWSSARVYALREPDPLVTEDPCYTELSPDLARRQRLWREFLLGDDPREEAVRKGDWAVGDDGFRGRMAQVLGRPLPRPRGRPPKAGRVQAGPLMTQVSAEQ
jgi:putative transposase